ncbi:Dihydrolipoyl dehydrogenase [Planctomycetales bacterium 10988]|nr:Dihydrolipoyl dehydrogenase [Planctomycetales bacterium 10988]
MKEIEHELVVIGAGPGGYVAAIRAAQLGVDVACIDENARFGGTCLRVGCIPSKAMLESSHAFQEAKETFRAHGVKLQDVQLDLSAMLKRKEEIVDTLTQGIDGLFKKNKVKGYRGRARIKSPTEVIVQPTQDSGDEYVIKTKGIILAMGSQPAPMKGIELDDQYIGTSTTALSYDKVPKKLVVIGAGYIGLELGSVWNRLGSEVIMVEALDRILPLTDTEIAKMAKRMFEKQGLKFKLGQWVEGAKVEKGRCIVKLKDQDPIEADRVLLSTGRTPYTANMGLEEVGVEMDKRGFIQVNDSFSTSVQGIYAIGDCIGGALLAHKASDEGVACVEKMIEGHGHLDYNTIPSVVYTHPEIAAVGKTEDQLKEEKIPYKKGVCSFRANGRARTIGETEGFVKVLAHEETDRVLGAHILGAGAGDLLAEAAVAMQFGASSEDLARCCHSHPTMSEALHEAALDVNKRAIHF